MKWVNMHKREVPLYENYLAAVNYNQEMEKDFGFNFEHFVFYSEKGIVDSFIGEKDKKRISDILLKRIKRDRKYFDKLNSIFSRQTKMLKKWCQLINSADISKMDNKELLLFYKNLYYSLQRKSFTILRIPLLVEDLLSVIPKFRNKIIKLGEKRNEFAKYVYKAFYLTRDKLLVEIAKKLGVPQKHKLYILPKEIIKHLHSGEKFDKKLAALRFESYAVILQPKGIKVLSGHPAKIFRKKMKVVNINSFDGQTLRGTPASPGRVLGEVKIIKSAKEASMITKPVIVVCILTSAEFMPYFKKFRAVITEDSGILNHAAITSREFKIPCVAGVKNATKVLKDGDKVKVDANHGIVRIVNKSK